MNTKGKELILNKCFELLLLNGFDGVSITDIQRATGMSRGLIYHYYSGKEELFMEVTERYLLEFFRLDMEEIGELTIPDMIDYIERMYYNICSRELSEGKENINIMNYDFLFYQARLRSKEFEQRYRKIRDDELQAWRKVVANSQNAGHIAAEMDLDQVAKTFVYLVDGSWFNIDFRASLTSASAEITEMLTNYYNQIKCR
ncbi:MAG: TetR/AcrR family transcriptional regulator [Marinifilaceae bacterium]